MMALASSTANKIRFTFSSPDPNTVRFLAGSGFLHLLESAKVIVDVAHGHDTLDEFTYFRFADIDDMSTRNVAVKVAGERLAFDCRFHGDQIASFKRILGEALDNAVEHAYGKKQVAFAPRLFAIRRFSFRGLRHLQARQLEQHLSAMTDWMRSLALRQASDFLEIAIVDVGLGILGTVRDSLAAYLKSRVTDRPLHAAELNDLNALEFVLSDARSTSLPDKNRGHGLYDLKNHVQAWDGLLSVRSGHAGIVYAPGGVGLSTSSARRSFFPGTQIRIILPIQDRREYIRYVMAREAARNAQQWRPE
jgi:hypothetical protein